MSDHHVQRRQLLLAGIAGAVSGPLATASSSAESAPMFWSQLAGDWLGELSYLGSEMEPIIQSYSAVIAMTLSGNRLSRTEYKFYPPGAALAKDAGGDDLAADEGVEVITSLEGHIANERWTCSANEVYRLVDDATLVCHRRASDADVPGYVSYWTLTSPRTLMITTLGILSSRYEVDGNNQPVEPLRANARLGELKGCSVFRYTRLEDGGVAQERLRLGESYNVKRSVKRSEP
jgi:hypothetical protein